MKPILYGLFCIALSAIAISQTRTDVTMIVDSVQREFIVVAPSHAPPAGGYPIVMMLHGTTGDGQKFYNISRWKEKGEEENFVTVFPSSLSYCFYRNGQSGPTHNVTKWKNGNAVFLSCPGVWMKDDVKFLRTMIDTIATTLPIDKRRIYASGFSNGGGMVSKLAVDMNDVFAAIAPAAGALHASDLGPTERGMPMWFILGTKDNKWLESFESSGLSEFPFNDSTATHYLAGTINRYLTACHLTQDYTRDSSALFMTYKFNTPADTVQSNEFRFTLIKGMGHVYPNGTNVPFVAANVFWDFFSQYALPVTSVEGIPVPTDLSFYPNPAKDYIIVNGESEATLFIYSMLGQLVHQTSVVPGMRVSLPYVAPGVYQLVMETKANRMVKMLMIR
jgi:polyhydroxybutyrate depolymerase